MSESHPKTDATSHLAGYCGEAERLANTIHGILAQCRTLSVPLGEDRAAVESLRSAVDTLRESIETTLEHDDEKNAPPPLDAVRDSTGARVVTWTQATPQSPPQPVQSESADPEPSTPPSEAEPVKTFEPTGTSMSQHVESLFEERIEPDLRALDELSKRRGVPSTLRCAEVLMADLKRQAGFDDPDNTHGEITFQGTSESLPLESVFEMVSATKKTGTLSVKTQEELLTFEIVEGELVASSTSQPPPHQLLGQILVDFGFVDPHRLSEFLEQHDSPPKLGEALERGDLVSRDDLRTALDYQIRHRLLRAFRADQSAFTFCEGGPATPDGRVRFNVAELLLRRRMSR